MTLCPIYTLATISHPPLRVIQTSAWSATSRSLATTTIPQSPVSKSKVDKPIVPKLPESTKQCVASLLSLTHSSSALLWQPSGCTQYHLNSVDPSLYCCGYHPNLCCPASFCGNSAASCCGSFLASYHDIWDVCVLCHIIMVAIQLLIAWLCIVWCLFAKDNKKNILHWKSTLRNLKATWLILWLLGL